MVVAAWELSESDGFRSTIVTAIDDRVGVSAESGIRYRAVFDFVNAGDDR